MKEIKRLSSINGEYNQYKIQINDNPNYDRVMVNDGNVITRFTRMRKAFIFLGIIKDE